MTKTRIRKRRASSSGRGMAKSTIGELRISLADVPRIRRAQRDRLRKALRRTLARHDSDGSAGKEVLDGLLAEYIRAEATRGRS